MKLETNLVPHIFIDGSHSPVSNRAGIGIYDRSNKTHLSYEIKAKSSYAAEKKALTTTIKYIKENNFTRHTKVFTDCMNVYTNYKDKLLEGEICELIWIPRYLNKESDNLAGIYKNTESTSVTSVNMYNNSLVTTTKTKTKTTTQMKTTKEIIGALLEFSLADRVKLLKKLADVSTSDNAIAAWEQLNNQDQEIHIKTKTVYLRLMLLLVPEMIGKTMKKRFLKTKKKIPAEVLRQLLYTVMNERVKDA